MAIGLWSFFTHGYREKPKIIKYIRNQEEHHSKTTFREEYLSFLKAYDIEFKNEYLFEFLG